MFHSSMMICTFVWFLLEILLQFHVETYTIDEVIHKAAESPAAFGMVAQDDIMEIMFEMDIRMNLDDFIKMKEESAWNETRPKRKAVRKGLRRWTDNIVPYEFGYPFNSAELAVIHSAIDEWRRHTCLDFRKATNEDKNKISFEDGDGCSSYMGMIGGKQKITLASGCRVKQIVIHEIGHAIGFQHEQSRPDRDEYVEIVEKNLPSSLDFNFEKLPYSVVNTYDVKYDYRSIMHYGTRAFSTNGEITVRTKDGYFQDVIGHAPTLSYYDIQLANVMYRCNERCDKINCTGGGFQGADCKCRCSSGNPDDPVVLCDGSKIKIPPPIIPIPDKGDCTDRNTRCEIWAKHGHCKTDYSYMSMYCRRSCETCGPAQDICRDNFQHCSKIRRQGYCSDVPKSFLTLMHKICARTCGFCEMKSAESNAETQALGSSAGDLRGNTVTLFSICLFIHLKFLFQYL